jgi:1-aminocyclopropane-1-carboxylate deaminase/D-cysteine desulfhydrase-like pyridoxal-dependent ACC family enzyme
LGGSNPTGSVAYAFALQELLQQNQVPDWIVLASSSGGTQAGLVLGSRLFDFQGKILGISIDAPKQVLQERVARLAGETAGHLGENCKFASEDILVNDDYLGDGYGIAGEPEKEAIQWFARNEGILLDPVYTSRAAAGLIGLIRQGFFAVEQRVLFWHTGGTPALFADRYQQWIR